MKFAAKEKGQAMLEIALMISIVTVLSIVVVLAVGYTCRVTNNYKC